jgi:hypothetical protein
VSKGLLCLPNAEGGFGSGSAGFFPLRRQEIG